MTVFEATGLAGTRAAPRAASRFPPLSAAFLVFAAYYLGAKLGLALTFHPNPISVLWPPNAILLAALLLAPARWWWVLLAAAFPAHLLAELQVGVPVTMVLCWFVSNASEALIGAIGVRWLVRGPLNLDSQRNLVIVIGCAVLLAPFLSSFLDAAFVTAIGWGSGDYWQLWRTRFFSNVLAALALVPLIVTFAGSAPGWFRSGRPRRYLEAGALLAGLLVVGVFVFDLPEAGSGLPPGLLYLPLPFLLWAALRFGAPGASAAFALVAFLVVWGAANGHGPFTSSTSAQNALSVQLFLVFVGVMLLAVAAEVQERRSAEQSLRRSEECFSSAFRGSPDAMAISRVSDGMMIEVNERWLAMFGHAREAVVGRTALDFDLYAEQGDHQKLKALADTQGRVRELEMGFRTRGGEVVQAAVSSEPVQIAGEACLVTIIRDVSDRKRAEEANDRLAHVSRLAVMGELTASIAHEINQPLGAILSNADAAEMLLRRDPLPVDDLRQVLDDISKDGIRAGEVMRHMRSLLQRRELAMHPVDLNVAIRDVLELTHADLDRRRVSVSTEFGPLPVVYGDVVHLQQVVLNLILNGVDAMSEVPPSRRRIELRTARSEAGGVEVSVSDTGSGIAQDQAEKLFQSFYTTKKDGMGLGLAIARSIVEAHGGRIWAESRPKGGASFRFLLPARAAHADAERVDRRNSLPKETHHA